MNSRCIYLTDSGFPAPSFLDVRHLIAKELDGNMRQAKGYKNLAGLHGEAIGFIRESKDTELELDFLGSTIELGGFCCMERFSENIWKLPQC